MAKLSEIVAVVDDGGRIVEYRDLGPEPVEVKDTVLPVVERRADLRAGEIHGDPMVEIDAGARQVVRTFPAVVPAPEPPSLEDRLAVLEDRVMALEKVA